MKRPVTLAACRIASGLAVVFLALASVSNMHCTQPPPFKPLAWQAGQWVEYSVSGRRPAGAPGTVQLRYSLTGEQTEDAVRYFWYETQGTLDTSRFIFRVMVPERQLNQAHRVVIKIGTETAKEMPDELSDAPVEYQLPFFNPADVAHAKPKPVVLKTPAGSFRCLNVRLGSAEVWLSSEVPVTGIVRYKAADQVYELTGLGRSGAASAITELPEKIDLNKIFPADSANK